MINPIGIGSIKILYEHQLTGFWFRRILPPIAMYDIKRKRGRCYLFYWSKCPLEIPRESKICTDTSKNLAKTKGQLLCFWIQFTIELNIKTRRDSNDSTKEPILAILNKGQDSSRICRWMFMMVLCQQNKRTTIISMYRSECTSP